MVTPLCIPRPSTVPTLSLTTLSSWWILCPVPCMSLWHPLPQTEWYPPRYPTPTLAYPPLSLTLSHYDIIPGRKLSMVGTYCKYHVFSLYSSFSSVFDISLAVCILPCISSSFAQYPTTFCHLICYPLCKYTYPVSACTLYSTLVLTSSASSTYCQNATLPYHGNLTLLPGHISSPAMILTVPWPEMGKVILDTVYMYFCQAMVSSRRGVGG